MAKHGLTVLSALLITGLILAVGCSDFLEGTEIAEIGDIIEDETDEADVDPEEDAEPAEPREEQVFVLTPDSSIVFEGSKTIDTRVGGFAEFEGSVVVPDGNPEEAKITIDIDMESIYSDSTVLTRVLRNEDYFNVETYPTAKFVSTDIEKTNDDRLRITGNLTIRGITRSVGFTANLIEMTDDRIEAEADFAVNRSAWEVGQDSWEGQLIRDEVKLGLYVVAEAE